MTAKPNPLRYSRFNFAIFRYLPTPYGDWSERFHGASTLPPLLVPIQSIVAVALNHEAVRIDVDACEELSRFKLPFAKTVEWSVDPDEVYVFLGYDQTTKVVNSRSKSGASLWLWEDKVESDAWAKNVPPLRYGPDRVYVLTKGRILAIEKGHLVWAYDLRSEGLRHRAKLDDGSFELKDGKLLAKGAIRHGSVLADSSLLVTSGKSLFHISESGSKLFALDLGDELLSAPVLDDKGNIYVTTTTRLIRVE